MIKSAELKVKDQDKKNKELKKVAEGKCGAA